MGEPASHPTAAVADAGLPPITTVPPIVHEALRSEGQPLEPMTRAPMESRFDEDFRSVCLHTDGLAAQAARVGNRLLAHGPAHVVQESGAAPAVDMMSRADDSFEQVAEGTSQQVALERQAEPCVTEGPPTMGSWS